MPTYPEGGLLMPPVGSVAARPGFVSLVAMALYSLYRFKSRSILAMLGIILGVGSVIATLALGEGSARDVQARITRLGANHLAVRPGVSQDRSVRLNRAFRQSLKYDDAAAIEKHCPSVRLTSPRVRGEVRVQYGGENQELDVEGVTPEFFTIRNYPLDRGRLFGGVAVVNRQRVCVLGAEAAEDLFQEEDPLGRSIKIRGQPYRVLGILRPRSGTNDDFDETVWIPTTTAMDRLYNLRYIHRIEVSAVSPAKLASAQEEMTALLRERHRLRPDQQDDFLIRNQLDVLETASATSQVFTGLLAGIAGISLLVGGIGIMNIMLVSVAERTREIGIRRAVGARRADIMWQFLAEAVIICCCGAALGVGAGLGGSNLGNSLAGWPMHVTWPSIVISCITAVAVGLMFGTYPAMRAAGLSPMDALRSE